MNQVGHPENLREIKRGSADDKRNEPTKTESGKIALKKPAKRPHA